MNFVAIDFETANASIGSACEIGLVVVENSKIVDSHSLLIKPRDNWFHFFNTKLHGIDAEKVENEPEFDELWETLKPLFEGKNVIAHNAGFDMGVLRSVLEMYRIDFPKFHYACSVKISKKAWPQLGSHKLNIVSDYINIELDHHHALDDAIACAKIVLQASKENNIENFEDLKKVFSVNIIEFKEKPLRFSTKKPRSNISKIEFDRDKVDQGHLYYQKCVVFTGRLNRLVRKEAQKMVLEIGGSCGTFIDGRTDYLVVGDRDYLKYKKGKISSKLHTAEALQSDGHRIEIVSESNFLENFNIGQEKIGGLFEGFE